METNKEWLTIKEAAEYLGVSYGRFTTLVKKGIYPVSKVPGFKKMIRVSRTRLDQMMMENEEVGDERVSAPTDQG